MGRKVERLTAMAVAKMKRPGYHPDGAGLYLQVSPTGTKSWVLRYRLGDKQREMGLGSAAVFTLAEARARAQAERKLLADKIDPIETRRARVMTARLESAKSITFEDAAEQYIATHEASWRNAKHVAQWRNTLRTHAMPKLGTLPVQAIDTGLVLAVLEPIWSTTTETATRLRGRIEKILDWAKVRGYRTGDNPAVWGGHLQNLLAAPKKIAKVKHQPALPYTELGRFMKALRAAPGDGARALELAILCGSRSGEVVGATWSEFDLDTQIWAIPGGRMKAGREHRVPLSGAAVALLAALPRSADSDLLFPARTGAPLSDMTLTAAVRRLHDADLKAGGAGFFDPKQEKRVTVHGFRSTFRDWIGEQTSYPRNVAEMALAHAIGDKVEEAYARGELLEKRTALMNDWARFCEGKPPVLNVVQIPEQSKAAA